MTFHSHAVTNETDRCDAEKKCVLTRFGHCSERGVGVVSTVAILAQFNGLLPLRCGIRIGKPCWVVGAVIVSS